MNINDVFHMLSIIALAFGTAVLSRSFLNRKNRKKRYAVYAYYPLEKRFRLIHVLKFPESGIAFHNENCRYPHPARMQVRVINGH